MREAARNHGCSPFSSKAELAFSLVEVILALGVVSFALLGMVALLPIGIQATRESLEETGAINLLSEVVADRKAASGTVMSPLYRIAPLNVAGSNSFGVTATNTVSTGFTGSLYRVTYVVVPPAAGPNPYQIYFKISWPVGEPSASATSYVEAAVTVPQQ
jgi:type II secretory pathway pseudopilin PulG